MWEHLLAKAHIAKLNQLTESEVTELTSSTVDETALAILKKQGSRGITIVSVPRKMILDIEINPYRPKWQTKRSKQADKDFETSEFHQDTWNRYLMSEFVSAHIPWNAISNLELRRSYNPLRDDLVLPSATTLRNICRREYALTVESITKQLPIRNKVSLASDGRTDINKQTSHNVGHCVLYGSKLGIAWSSTRCRWGESPVRFPFRTLINDDRSRPTILEQGYPYIWRTCLIVLSLPTAACLVLQLIMLRQTTRWHASCNQHLRPLESSGWHWGTTYHAWRTSESWLLVHSWAVSV